MHTRYRVIREIQLAPSLRSSIWSDPYPFAVTDSAITNDIASLCLRVQSKAEDALRSFRIHSVSTDFDASAAVLTQALESVRTSARTSIDRMSDTTAAGGAGDLATDPAPQVTAHRLSVTRALSSDPPDRVRDPGQPDSAETLGLDPLEAALAVGDLVTVPSAAPGHAPHTITENSPDFLRRTSARVRSFTRELLDEETVRTVRLFASSPSHMHPPGAAQMQTVVELQEYERDLLDSSSPPLQSAPSESVVVTEPQSPSSAALPRSDALSDHSPSELHSPSESSPPVINSPLSASHKSTSAASAVVSDSLAALERKVKEVMTVRWTFEPALDSPLLRRVTKHIAFPFLLSIAMAVWVFAVMIGRQLHPAVLSLVFFGLICFVFSVLVWSDRRLLYAQFFYFEFFWIAFNTILFVVLVAWAEPLNNSLTFAVQHAVTAGVIQLFSLFHDPSLTNFRAPLVESQPQRKRNLVLTQISHFSWFSLACAHFLYILVMDRFFTPLIGEAEFCIFFCTDARRLASYAASQCFYFFVKYAFKTISNILMGRHELIVARLPFACEVMALKTPASSESDSPLDPSLPLTARLRQFFARTPAPRILHMSCHITDAYTRSRQQSRVRVYRAILFRPVVAYPPLINLANDRTYQYFLMVSVFILVAFESIASVMADTHAAALSMVALPFVLALCFVELTRFDRTLLSMLLRRFEWWLLLLSMTTYTVFGIMSTVSYGAGVQFSFVGWIIFALILSCLDAAPAYPIFLKRVGFLAMLLNTLRVYVTQVVSPTYAYQPLCVLFCVDTRSLALTGLFTYTAFATKYLFTLLSRPRDCRLLYMPITASFTRTVIGTQVDKKGNQSLAFAL